MKKQLFILLISILLCTLSSYAAEWEQSFKFKTVYCSDYSQPFTYYGLEYEFDPTEKLSLSYSLSMTYSKTHGLYLQTGTTQSIGFLLLLMDDYYNDIGWLGLLCIIVPNEVTYTITEKEKTALRGYIAPINSEIFFNNNAESVFTNFDLSTELGVKLRYLPKSFFEITPKIGMKRFYYSRRNAFNVGVSMGIRF